MKSFVSAHRLASGAGRIALLIALIVIGGLGWLVYERLTDMRAAAAAPRAQQRATERAVPVEVSPVLRGSMELKRRFSGTLEARAQFLVAPKISGRIERMYVELADEVRRGQLVAELDNAEYRQSVAQAEADLEVAKATLVAARSGLEIADREVARIRKLLERGIATDTEFDVAKAGQLAKQAEVEVARAGLSRAEAVLESRRIQLEYTRVKADWNDGRDARVVAERFVDEGGTVAANTALLRIVELHSLTAVIFVTEKDYVYLRPGQTATLSTDAWAGERFQAQIERIAPVFREETRQARVELRVDNAQLRLKPGMFIRATVVLQELQDAVSVPEAALTVRKDEDGVFLVDSDSESVSWQPVQTGIRDAGRVQIRSPEMHGNVVVLGQQFLDHGSIITVPQ